jgi:hypothetical protein
MLHNEELHNLYAFPDVFRVMKSRGMMHGPCSTHGTVWTGYILAGFCERGNEPSGSVNGGLGLQTGRPGVFLGFPHSRQVLAQHLKVDDDRFIPCTYCLPDCYQVIIRFSALYDLCN